MNLALSIIIPTYMRHEVLWKTIQDLLPQFIDEDELLIMDQNTPPLTLPENLKQAKITLHHMERPSLTRARNLGIEKSKHDQFIFLDDDIIPDANLLARFRHLSKANLNCIITGKVDQEDKSKDLAPPGFVNLKTGEIRTNFSQAFTGDRPFFPGGLVLIPRLCLPPPPYFCPAFRGASQGEEIDFSLRVKKRGIRILSDASISIYHLKVQEGGCRAPDFRKKFYLDQIFNEALFFGRHGNLFHLLKFLQRLKNFIEFHTRSEGALALEKGIGMRPRHSPNRIFQSGLQLFLGLVTGIRLRLF